MIKTYTITLREGNEAPKPELLRHWKEDHARLAAKILPGVKKYIQCHPIEIPGFQSDVARIAEMWWENVESYLNYLKWRQTDAAKPLLADEQKMTASRRIRFIAEEFVALDLYRDGKIARSENAFKTFAIGLKEGGRPMDEKILRYWKERHAPFAVKIIPGLCKYVQAHPVEVPEVQTEVARSAEIWWNNVETYQKYQDWRKTDAAKPLLADEQKMSASKRLRFVAKEFLVLER